MSKIVLDRIRGECPGGFSLNRSTRWYTSCTTLALAVGVVAGLALGTPGFRAAIANATGGAKVCTPKERKARQAALESFKRQLPDRRRAYFRTHKRLNDRRGFDARQRARLKDLHRAVAACSIASRVGVAHSTRTIFPTAKLTLPAVARLNAARNEFESFQVVVQAGTRPIRGLDVTLQRPIGRIPKGNVAIYEERYYKVTWRSDLEGQRRLYPDALVPKVDTYYRRRRNAFRATSIIRPDSNRAAWIDVLVPAKQKPGVYRGSLLVTARSGLPPRGVTIPIQLTVLDMPPLPSTPTLASAFDLGDPKPCAAHGGCAKLSTEEKWALHTLYARASLEHRIQLFDPAPGPPGNQGDLFTQYAAKLLAGQSPRRLVNGANVWSPVRLEGARLPAVFLHTWCTGSCLTSWRDVAAAFPGTTFYFYCDEKGRNPALWNNCYNALVEARGVWARDARAGELKVATTASLADAAWAERNTSWSSARNDIDLLIPNVQALNPKNTPHPGTRPEYSAFLNPQGDDRGGDKAVWTYTSCSSFGCGEDMTESRHELWRGWPSYAIDQPAAQARAMGWVAFTYELSGELYYESAVRLAQAWNTCEDRNRPPTNCLFVYGGNGDGTLFYPGTSGPNGKIGGPAGTDIPIESIRLKRIRDGREDYEYLNHLAKNGKAPQAKRIALNLFPVLYQADTPGDRLQRARCDLARLVDRSACR